MENQEERNRQENSLQPVDDGAGKALQGISDSGNSSPYPNTLLSLHKEEHAAKVVLAACFGLLALSMLVFGAGIISTILLASCITAAVRFFRARKNLRE